MSLPRDIVAVSLEQVWQSREATLTCLSAEERQTYDRLRVQKRRRDFLGGRIAAKRAVQKTHGIPFDRITIRRDQAPETEGRPLVLVDGGSIDLFVSLSHSTDLAIATVSNNDVGLDLEIIKERDRSFADLFLTPTERRSLLTIAVEDHAAHLTNLWCVKEAYAKWRGKGLTIPFSELTVPHGLEVETGSFCFGDDEMSWAKVFGPVNDTFVRLDKAL